MDIEQISFQIISFAGDSFSTMLKALGKAMEKDFDSADKLMEEAKKTLDEAHNVEDILMSTLLNIQFLNFWNWSATFNFVAFDTSIDSVIKMFFSIFWIIVN